MLIIARRDTHRFRDITHPLSVGFVYGTTAFFVLMQMLYVVPQLFDTGGMMYMLAWIVAGFISFNICANMRAGNRTYSSVMGLPWKRRFPSPGEESLWHYCDPCQRLMPPRSWHCRLCQCCILKRDHHCIFTANCVGHNNQRYFFWFTFYMSLGLLLALGSSSIVMLKNYDIRHLVTWLWPLSVFLIETAPGPSPPIWLGLTISCNTYILLCPLLMFIIQLEAVLKNRVFFDLLNDTYDVGLRENLRSVMGERGLWTFLSPTVESPLSHDGTQWPVKPLKEGVAIKEPLSCDKECSACCV